MISNLERKAAAGDMTDELAGQSFAALAVFRRGRHRPVGIVERHTKVNEAELAAFSIDDRVPSRLKIRKVVILVIETQMLSRGRRSAGFRRTFSGAIFSRKRCSRDRDPRSARAERPVLQTTSGFPSKPRSKTDKGAALRKPFGVSLKAIRHRHRAQVRFPLAISIAKEIGRQTPNCRFVPHH